MAAFASGRWVVPALLLGILLAVSACGGGEADERVGISPTTGVPVRSSFDAAPIPAPDEPLRLEVETVADGLSFPVQLAARPGSEVAYLITRDGRMWMLEGGELEQVLDIGSRVLSDHEQGLLGIALHPDDASRFYLYYIDLLQKSTLSEFRFDPEGRVDPASERVLLRVDQPDDYHNAGMLQFGPDGQLYVALGDGGGIGDPYGNGQDTSTLLGSILRIDPDGGDPYAVPPSNPFVGRDGADEIWGYGFRNPWRFWIDHPTATIYIGDVGQAEYEEINVVGITERGRNFGWPLMEGSHCYEPEEDCRRSGLVLPEIEIDHGEAGACAVVGGVVYRGDEFPQLDGAYLYSDYCGGWLRSFRWNGEEAVAHRDLSEQVGPLGQVTSIGMDGVGGLYVTTTDSLLRLRPGGP